MPLSPDTHQAALPATQGALGWARTAASSARAAFCACAFRDAASPTAWCLFQKELLPAGQRRGPSHGAVVVAGSGLHLPNFSSHVAPSSAASTLPPAPVRSVCPLGFDLRRSAGAALKPVLSATPRSLCPSVSAESFSKARCWFSSLCRCENNRRSHQTRCSPKTTALGSSVSLSLQGTPVLSPAAGWLQARHLPVFSAGRWNPEGCPTCRVNSGDERHVKCRASGP